MPSVFWPATRAIPSLKQRAETDRAAPHGPAISTDWPSASISSAISSTLAHRRLPQHRSLGYTVKREYFNVEFSAGIENIGYDAINGPAFADVHPHGEAQGLSRGTAGSRSASHDRAGAAWNPIGGMTDRVRTADVASPSATRRCFRHPTRQAGCSIASQIFPSDREDNERRRHLTHQRYAACSLALSLRTMRAPPRSPSPCVSRTAMCRRTCGSSASSIDDVVKLRWSTDRRHDHSSAWL